MKIRLRSVAITTVALLITTIIALGGGFKKLVVWSGIVKPGLDSNSTSTVLPNGWRITPAGHHIPLPGDMVMKIIPSPDGKKVLASTAGWHDHSVSTIDLQSEKTIESVNVGKIWTGMAQDPTSGTVFVSGGGAPTQQFLDSLKARGVTPEVISALHLPILRLQRREGKLAIMPSLEIKGVADKERFVGGVTCGTDRSLYVVNTQNDTVYRLSGTDFKTQVSIKVGYRPYAAVLSPDSKQLAVSNWGGESISILDVKTLTESSRVKVESHPNDLAFSADGRLFVANAGSNSVSVIRDGKLIETIKTSFEPKALVGSTPCALAITADGKRLYVANADNNDVAVIDISNPKESSVLGFIPTAWYPSAIAVSTDGKKLFVGTGKGGLNLNGNFPAETEYKVSSPDPKKPYDYVGGKLVGTLSIVDVPDKPGLAAYTAQVKSNFPNPEAMMDNEHAERITKQVFPKIKHILYIIRENRTYDQVFGDLGKGNGDPNLTLFGEKTTPNAHKLARETVVFDNLYCNGEVSQDGHQWSNAAYATDFTQKAWVNSYSKRGQPDADERLTASPAGYLWDNCRKHGKTYRSYGEFASFRSSPEKEPTFVGNRDLKDHVSTEWLKLKMGPGRQRDTKLAEVFIKELKEAEAKGEWWDFMVMSLGEDHTDGLSAGRFTPTACVASNDLALGMIIEAITNSRFWPETAIFIIEDDAQNGPDHVDARRTVGLVYSPYVKRGVVDSTMYTTVSYVRTMELILNLPPMTQYDALATPMYNVFTTTPQLSQYKLVPAQEDLLAKNPEKGWGAVRSAKLDWSDYDRADFDELNEILWDALKGTPMPAPVRGALLQP
ncbi:MAG TPA: bifunctional YncE family protein/alkaline phosphatase family protein [Blastocatellia bacterium]|nr:bifunctional YncE family protein/alkaline phosphatase family protein [Blastocatellia bacterium]